LYTHVSAQNTYFVTSYYETALLSYSKTYKIFTAHNEKEVHVEIKF